jgi:hypothetical protein
MDYNYFELMDRNETIAIIRTNADEVTLEEYINWLKGNLKTFEKEYDTNSLIELLESNGFVVERVYTTQVDF